ncbi:APC family amino acid-polyamine-organocationtransporter [Weissella oryzae SG25]|uniref:APC family amino acid-polyamine-organocationtransporter n=1 Tax=Weissella oryzae (strain DSM 25784 / JCM 18191 / LMG 30913 / SG25) TaxID=1329250 RepID=A0A069CRR5_WEIOS|nr:amino acid permease [Weissella oryzae]GAK30094.1 APC family amino acid-polyamine-organocationtransporter [Weissella oryzae SG25]
MEQQGQHLRRSMGVMTGVSIVIGTVIGSGIFFKQAEVLTTAGGTTAGLLAWIIGGLITLAAGLTIAEVGARIPETGGLYVYVTRLYGKFWGFLTGWTQVAIYAPGIVAALATYFALLFANFFGISTTYVPWIALITIFLVTGMNSLENRIPSAFQILTTSIKLIPIAGLIIFGLFFGKEHVLNHVITTAAGGSTSGNIGMAVLATLFAYDGWATLTNLGGELKNPRRTIPRSIIIGVLVVMLAYVGVSYGVYRSLPANEIVRLGDNVPYKVAMTAFGNLGGRLLSIGIMVSMLGTLNGKMLAFPRMIFAMAEDGVMPKSFKKLNRYQEPYMALWITAVLGAALGFTAAANWLSDMVVFIIWVFYLAVFFGVFKLRKQAKQAGLLNDPEIFQVPLYPIVPLVAIFGALFIEINTLLSEFTMVLTSFVFVLIGVPIYFYYMKKQANRQ